MELAIAKCINSPEYLSALGAAIGKALEKGMQDGLADGITHSKESKVLMDVAAHNPSAKADYISALQQLQNVNFPLLAELKSNKDASVEAIMEILRLKTLFGMENYDTVPTHMVEQAKLKLDLVGKPVDHTNYRSMIGSLMYVTSSRPDIIFATCMCARYQANPNELLGIKCTRHSHYQVKCSHWQYKFPLPVKVVATARRLEMPLPEVFTAIEEKKKKLPVKDRWQLH
nr:putative polyprotein [Tanacetum cinerariifolium]